MFNHFHCSNLTQINAYLRAGAPGHHEQTLIEISRRNPSLLRFLDGPVTGTLMQEVINAIKSVVDVAHGILNTPSGDLDSEIYASVSPTMLHTSLPRHEVFNPDTLWTFVDRIIGEAHIGPAQLIHAILVTESLKQNLPDLPADLLLVLGIFRDARSESSLVGLVCSHHRIALAILMINHQAFTDYSPRSRQWRDIARGFFKRQELSKMRTQVPLMVGFHVYINEQDLIRRFYRLIYSTSNFQSQFEPQSSLNPALPLSDSNSSDCLLNVINSYAMDEPSSSSSSSNGTSRPYVA
ncbi:hypothetical protein M408DRAFT_138754 [Serendipita vermifera MAFF 305830]|uniref:Uncharacterized protein n=1 Tax=Serendipita vermifera MAFF 305830 TaxID=933852 RepID=A0A0C2W1H7_SERVB|nr:hypothetical protein M408DRAFT_138754 [Serendipita vermifera MAFF 305830]